MSASLSDAGSVPQTTGFIDIGTNSVRLIVVRLEPDRSWSTITLQKEPVRLGEGEFGAESALQPEAMDGAQTVAAVATSATRGPSLTPRCARTGRAHSCSRSARPRTGIWSGGGWRTAAKPSRRGSGAP